MPREGARNPGPGYSEPGRVRRSRSGRGKLDVVRSNSNCFCMTERENRISKYVANAVISLYRHKAPRGMPSLGQGGVTGHVLAALLHRAGSVNGLMQKAHGCVQEFRRTAGCCAIPSPFLRHHGSSGTHLGASGPVGLEQGTFFAFRYLSSKPPNVLLRFGDAPANHNPSFR